ncbi:unnamed protein product [Cunninghamella blakesleeana]
MVSNKQNEQQNTLDNGEKTTDKTSTTITTTNNGSSDISKLKFPTPPPKNTQLKMTTALQQQNRMNQPLPELPGNINDPWEIYFDPNYTFFGGTVLDSRKHKQQYEILQAMAAQDLHLHLHPPFITPPSLSTSSSSSLISSSSLLNQQPTLPTDIMNSVDDQIIQTKTNNGKDKQKMIASSLSIENYHQQKQLPLPMIDEKEHCARLNLLKAIRAETYNVPTFPSSTFNTDHHPVVMLHKLDPNVEATTNQPPLLRNIKTHTINYQHRQRYRHLQQKATSLHQLPSSFTNPDNNGRSLNQSLHQSKKHIKQLEKQDKKTNKNPIDYFYSVSLSNESDATIKNEVSRLDDPEKHLPISHPPLPLHKHHLNTSNHNHPAITSSAKESLTHQLSFFFFLFGFVCPPLWLIGAIYTRPEHKYKTSEDKDMDLKWKKYSKIALGLFVFILLILLVILLLVNPGALGWRQSTHDQISTGNYVPVQTSVSH